MRKVLATRHSRAARTKTKKSRPAKHATKDPDPVARSQPGRMVDFPSSLARALSSVYPKAPATGPDANGWNGLGPEEEADIADYLSRVILGACKEGQLFVRVSYPSIAEAIGKELCADPPGSTFVQDWLQRNNYTYLRFQEFICVIWKE